MTLNETSIDSGYLTLSTEWYFVQEFNPKIYPDATDITLYLTLYNLIPEVYKRLRRKLTLLHVRKQNFICRATFIEIGWILADSTGTGISLFPRPTQEWNNKFFICFFEKTKFKIKKWWVGTYCFFPFFLFVVEKNQIQN